jgi:hypothetical protein
LQVLQVVNHFGTPITQASQAAVNAPDQVLLHSYGHSLNTRWVTIHNTAVDGTVPFNANTLAKAKDGTPFKRPENGLFVPGSGFKRLGLQAVHLRRDSSSSTRQATRTRRAPRTATS